MDSIEYVDIGICVLLCNEDHSVIGITHEQLFALQLAEPDERERMREQWRREARA